jgi:hypothetical protein
MADIQDRRLAQKLVHLPRFKQAWYDVEKNLIMAELNNHLLIAFPPYLGQEISQLSPEQLATVTLSPGQDALYWEEEGIGLEITSLLAGRFGSRKWMEKMQTQYGVPLGHWQDSELARAEWGKTGGSMKTPAKAQAARENGKKGGRPSHNRPQVEVG